MVRVADVVHEALHRPELGFGLRDEGLRRRRLGEVGDESQCRADLGARSHDALGVAAAHHHARSLVREQAGGCEADSARRAGDEANTVAQAEIHCRQAYSVARDGRCGVVARLD